jgi:virginiamycin B lyase
MTNWVRTVPDLGSIPGVGEEAGQAGSSRRLAILVALLLAATGLATAQAHPAAAAPATGAGIVTIFSSPNIHLSTGGDSYNGMTRGPDGALWFTNPGNNTIGRISTVGTVTDYRGRGIANSWAITTGSDGALWTGNWNTHSISRISTAGKVTTFPGTANTPTSIAGGGPGQVWYTNWASQSIGRITTGGKSTSFTASGVVYPQSITRGTNGTMWFTNGGVPHTDYSIGRITKTGHITIFPLSEYPGSIATGPDGALWFSYPDNNAIGRITTSGVLSRFTAPSISDPGAVATGSDGAIWFTEAGAIGRITTAGKVTSFPISGFPADGSDIVAGPDGAMWFTDPANDTIGRITTNVTPGINRKTPASGTPGTMVTILGRNLSPATQVTFNGVPAAIISDAGSYVVAIVPPGATTGLIAVTTAAGTAMRNGRFVVTRPRK